MKSLDIATALAMLVLSAVVAVGTLELPYWSEFAPGPGFGARWVAGLGAVIAVILLVQTLRRTEHEGVEWPDAAGKRRVLFAAASMWLFLALMPWVGFAFAALVFMIAMLVLVQRRPVVPSLTTAFLTVAATTAIFELWLKIDVPKGPFGF